MIEPRESGQICAVSDPNAAPPPPEPAARGLLSTLAIAALVLVLVLAGLGLYLRSQASDALPFDYQGFDSTKK